MRMSGHRTVLSAIVSPLLLAAVGVFAVGCAASTTPPAASPTPAAAASSTAPTSAAAGISVKGLVDSPTTLTAADLQKAGTETVTLQHPKNGATQYTGVPFKKVLELLKVKAAAKTVTLTASDGFTADVTLSDVTADAFLSVDAGSMSAEFPGQTTKTWVKDIASMEFK